MTAPVRARAAHPGAFAASGEQLRRPYPARAGVLAWLGSRPAVVLLPAAALVGALAGLLQHHGDQERFRQVGVGMLGPGLLDVFSDSSLQTGPLHLLGLGLLTWCASFVGLDDVATGVVSAVLNAVGVTWLALVTAGRAARLAGVSPLVARWGVGGGVLATGHLGANLFMHHPEEILLGLLLALAAVEVAAGRRGRAAGLLVVASGVTPWGLIAGGALVDRRSARASVSAVLVLGLGLVLVYAPFALWAEMRTADIVWRFSPHSWVGAVPFLADASDWTFRVLQGALAGAAGLLVALHGRRTPLLAVLVAVDVRLLLDPLRHSYYAGGLTAVLLVWLWTTPAARRARVPVTALLLVPTTAPLIPTAIWFHLGTVALVLLPLWCVRVEQRAARARPGTVAAACVAPADRLVADGDPGGAAPPRRRRDLTLADVETRHPRVAAVGAWLWHHPLALLVPLAICLIAPMVERVQPYDAVGFARAGRTMLTPEVWDVFADPWLQVGPALLLSSGVWATLADLVGLPPLLLVAAVHSAAILWLGDVVTRTWASKGRDATSARWAVGAALTLGGVMDRSFAVGHEEDLVVALLLAAAAAAAAGRRVVRGGLLLALAFGFKAWAVLGGGLVLSGRSPRRALIAAGTAAAVSALMFLPFLVGGEVRTLEYSWGIAGGHSLFGQLGQAWGLTDWGLRAVQAAVAGLAGAAVALRRHGSALAVVITAVGVRLLLEPHLLSYYCSPLVLLVVLWSWTTTDLRALWVRWATLLGTVVFLQHYYFVAPHVLQVTEAAAYVLVLVVVLGTELRAGRRARVQERDRSVTASTGRDADVAPTAA